MATVSWRGGVVAMAAFVLGVACSGSGNSAVDKPLPTVGNDTSLAGNGSAGADSAGGGSGSAGQGVAGVGAAGVGTAGTGTAGAGAAGAGAAGAGVAGAGAAGAGSAGAAVAGTGSAGAGTAGTGTAGAGGAGSAGVAAGMGAAGTGPAGMSAGGMGNLPPAGPEDGDPNAPIVSAPGVPCGANPSLLGLTATNATIGGRGVHVAYPCNKHAGAPVTFILNLHGTMPTEELKLYQVAYFAANNLVESHNLITVAPKSVVSQWGNGDGGVDTPHVMEVIEWTYSTFADFDIRAMWVGGHSWGSAYAAEIGCSAEIADRVKGLILMSGADVTGLRSAPCAERVAAIVSTAEGDGRMPADQSTLATSHGCDAGQQSMILNNDVTIWPNCTPNYVHATYYMLGKEHATYMDAEVVESIADLINLARP